MNIMCKYNIKKVSSPIIFNKNITSIFVSDQNEEHVEEKKYWTKNNTLRLINEVKENKQMFSSTTIRNEKVWQRISEHLKEFTAQQCENRWKYLKNIYLAKKENRRNRTETFVIRVL